VTTPSPGRGAKSGHGRVRNSCDAPDRISLDATGGSYAEQGGRQLDGFINGINATQQNAGQTDSHMTMIGHSYGSTVIGEGAKHGNGLAVDDIVVAGSPGMHVSSASDLNVGERHVWDVGYVRGGPPQ
jgi:hypothetical protein